MSETHPGFRRYVFVLAGSYQEFLYAKTHGFVPVNAVHVTSEARLMGVSRGSADLVKYGTWDERPYKDIAPVLDVCRSRGMREIPPLPESPNWLGWD